MQDGLTDSQRFNAFAVVTSVSYEGGVGKAVGLQKSPSTLRWAKSNTTGYNTNFTGIQADYSYSSSSGYTFTGDMDGSDNWEYICSIDPEGTLDPATNYPAFNFALTYGTTVGLTGTDYENGWYVPTIAELNGIYVKKDIIQTSLTAVNGLEIVSNYWLSSSQYELDNDDVYIMYSSGSVNFTWKDDGKYVLVLQAFNAEQFN